MKRPDPNRPMTKAQQLIIETIGARRFVFGAVLRQQLAVRGLSKSGPGFYALMADLEDLGIVTGWYQHMEVGGTPIKQRCFALTHEGIEKLK